MCGIVGYAGNVRTACGKPLEVCLQGLQRLEYRGYDSAGVALTAPGMERVAVRKKAGRLANLVQDIERDPMPDATVGIGHTRWATNGVPNDTNAHPHTSRDGKVAIIHNGIIENASQLRLDLQTEGYRFVSETDTEVAAKLQVDPKRQADPNVEYVVDVVGHGAAKYAQSWASLPEGGEVRDQALLDEGASGLERFAAFATSQQSLVNPEPVEPLYLRRPDVSVPNPLKHVLNHAGAERTE